jgi:glycosyltransferase involved in cell wall biosynthesis
MPPANPLTVAWISDFPIEWLPDIPEELRGLPREHPATWEMVLLAEFEKNPALQVHVIILRKNIGRSFSFERNGVTFHLLKYPGGVRAPTLFWWDTWLIRRALKKIKPDMVHAWGSERGAALVASRLKYPYVNTIQGLFSWYKEVIPLAGHDNFAVWTENVSLSRARHVTTESKFAVAYLQKRYPHLHVHQAEHASNWMFHQVQRKPITRPIRFLTNGTMGYRKGTDILLEALDQLTAEIPYEATIIGARNEPFLAPILAKLSEETRRRITFKSDLRPAEIARELSTATMFLLPTRADTSPNSVKESVVAGVPVVASAVGGIPDYVFPGENGLLFDTGNKTEFLAKIREAAAHSLFSQGKVTAESLTRNREYLSPSRMAELFLTVYRGLETKK